MEARYRLFGDFEEEERWINEMAAEGLFLKKVQYPRYLFERGEPGQFLYRMQCLKHSPKHPESQAYLDFLEEMGIERVASLWHWVYLRRPASEGPFEIHSDLDERIEQYGRIQTVLIVALILEALAAGLQLPFILGMAYGEVAWGNLVVGLFALVCAVWIGCGIRHFGRKIERLRADRRINET